MGVKVLGEKAQVISDRDVLGQENGRNELGLKAAGGRNLQQKQTT